MILPQNQTSPAERSCTVGGQTRVCVPEWLPLCHHDHLAQHLPGGQHGLQHYHGQHQGHIGEPRLAAAHLVMCVLKLKQNRSETWTFISRFTLFTLDIILLSLSHSVHSNNHNELQRTFYNKENAYKIQNISTREDKEHVSPSCLVTRHTNIEKDIKVLVTVRKIFCPKISHEQDWCRGFGTRTWQQKVEVERMHLISSMNNYSLTRLKT